MPSTSELSELLVSNVTVLPVGCEMQLHGHWIVIYM